MTLLSLCCSHIGRKWSMATVTYFTISVDVHFCRKVRRIWSKHSKELKMSLSKQITGFPVGTCLLECFNRGIPLTIPLGFCILKFMNSIWFNYIDRNYCMILISWYFLLSMLYKLFIVGSSAPYHLSFGILRSRINIWQFVKVFRENYWIILM